MSFSAPAASPPIAPAPRTALGAGLLSLTLAGKMLAWQWGENGRNIDARAFFVGWSLVAVAVLGLSAFFSWRGEQSGGLAGYRRALAGMLPSLVAGAAISACLTMTSGLPLFPALFWIVFYGLALISTRGVASSGLVVLGWVFLLSGLGGFIYLLDETIMPEFDLPTPTNLYPAAMMGLTFGVYHVIYALVVMLVPRRSPL